MPITYEVASELSDEEKQTVGKVLDMLYSNFQQTYTNPQENKISFTPKIEYNANGATDSVPPYNVRISNLSRPPEDILNTLLHEQQHVKSQVGQSKNPAVSARMKDSFSESQWLDIIQAGLPSLGEKSTEELLASLLPVVDMMGAGISSNNTSKVTDLMDKMPKQLTAYIQQNQFRDQPDLKAAPFDPISAVKALYKKLVPVRKAQ